MGNHSTKLSSKDITNNLFWSLQEQGKWQYQCESAEKAFHQSSAVDRTPVFEACEKQLEHVITKGDQTLHQVELILSGHWLPTITSSTGQTVPGAHPVHGALASQLFAMAATSEVAYSQHNVVSAEDLEALVDTKTESVKPDDAVRSLTPMVSHMVLNETTNDRVELCSKYLFIDHLLQKLVASAEHCFKLNARRKMLQNLVKTASLSNAVIVQGQLHQTEALLQDAFQCWENARETVDWLYRDYAIEVATQKVAQQIRLTREFYDHLFPPTATDVKAEQQVATTVPLEAFQVTTNSEFLQQCTERLDDLVLRLTQTKIRLNSCALSNEIEALRIGFDFLDMKHAGKLYQTDLPDLTPNLFAVLCANHPYITTETLHRGISQLATELDSITMKLLTLQQNIDRLRGGTSKLDPKDDEMIDKEQEIRAFTQRGHQIKTTLNEIYKFFLQAFTSHVFNQMEGQLKAEQTIQVDLLLGNLLDIESSSRLFINPFEAHHVDNDDDQVAPINERVKTAPQPLAPSEAPSDVLVPANVASTGFGKEVRGSDTSAQHILLPSESERERQELLM